MVVGSHHYNLKYARMYITIFRDEATHLCGHCVAFHRDDTIDIERICDHCFIRVMEAHAEALRDMSRTTPTPPLFSIREVMQAS